MMMKMMEKWMKKKMMMKTRTEEDSRHTSRKRWAIQYHASVLILVLYAL